MTSQQFKEHNDWVLKECGLKPFTKEEERDIVWGYILDQISVGKDVKELLNELGLDDNEIFNNNRNEDR